MRLSIRWRLALWNTLALAVMLFGFSAAVYALMAHALYHQLDQSLRAEYQQLQQDDRLRDDPAGRLRYWIDEFKEHEGFCCVVYGPSGQVYLRTPELAADSIPPAPVSLTAEPRFNDVTVPILGRQRSLTGRLELPSQELTVVHLASLQDVDHELGELRDVLVQAVPAAVLLFAGLGYWMARKALAPVEQLHRTTEQITADRLDRRLPVVNPDDELGRLAQTINAMIARLEQSFTEIRRFTADASHELRTPLTAIRTEAEVALAKPLSPADCQSLLGSVLEECERLTRLTDQLLTLSREDAGTVKLAGEPVDLAVLLRDVVETMRPLAEAKKLHLQGPEHGPVQIYGDPGRLRQVFYNLLDNAIKYTPAEGTVEVRLGRQDHSAIVRVRDTGIGIPPEHLPRVFDRFYRVDKARSRAEGGTGLGLSIVQSILTAHGGRIELASTSGGGTTCMVTLPERAKP
jgi:heavy metal sensor kinase